ncbi:MAG: EF-hand domain-containing protein [Paracoccaceae bacterium]
MTHRIALILPVVALGFATAAVAQTLPEIADTDGNGTWSLAELQTVWPDLTDEVYLTVDANADGGADTAEVTKAMADGILKPVE